MRKDAFFETLVIAGFSLLYMLFPTTNFTGDALGYAGDIKYGISLFLPHHLLFSPFNYSIACLFNISNTLALTAFVNAVFAGGALVVMRFILRRLLSGDCRTVGENSRQNADSDRTDSSSGNGSGSNSNGNSSSNGSGSGENTRKGDCKKGTVWWLLFIGSCFGFMRYSTLGEVYIIPIFFSLLASALALYKKPIWLCGLSASIAVLFHQMHFFWWIGLAIFIVFSVKTSRERWRALFQYAAISLIAPAVYILVFYFTPNDTTNIFAYLFHDYVSYEYATFSFFSGKALFLTAISFFRTFFQVHGYIFSLFRYSPIFILCAAVALFLLITALVSLRKTRINHSHSYRLFGWSHTIIFFLHFLLAAGDAGGGNAELMIMLPFALIIILLSLFKFQRFPVLYFALGIFVWNISFGLIPQHFLQLTPDKTIVKYIQQRPNEKYFLFDRHIISETLRLDAANSREDADDTATKWHIYINRTASIDTLLQKTCVITDIGSPRPVSRTSIVLKEAALPPHATVAQRDTLYYDLGIVVMTTLCIDTK
ncbi:MAG: hypothetical protein LBF01_02975 [Bacteroidales bacterium]|jgi:hypothetical protein|nr:hypothetical protein [Bacteroidales bacterium]